MGKQYQIECENGVSFLLDEKGVNRLLEILDDMTDGATGGCATLGHIAEKLKSQKENGTVLGLTKIEAELLQSLIREHKEPELIYKIPISFLEAISLCSVMQDLSETEGGRSKICQKVKAKMELAMDTLKEESVLDGVETLISMNEKEITVTCSMLLQIVPLYAEKEDPDFWNHVLPALIACDVFRRKCEKERKSQVPPILWKLPKQEPFTLTLPQMEDLLSICYLLEPEQPDEALAALRQKLSDQLNRIRSGKDIICTFTEEETVLLKNVKDQYRKIYNKTVKRGFPEYPEDIWICCL